VSGRSQAVYPSRERTPATRIDVGASLDHRGQDNVCVILYQHRCYDSASANGGREARREQLSAPSLRAAWHQCTPLAAESHRWTNSAAGTATQVRVLPPSHSSANRARDL
jgi:hypothetical protein